MTSEAARKAWETKWNEGHRQGVTDGRRQGLADGHLSARANLVRAILVSRGIAVSRNFPSPDLRDALMAASDEALSEAVLGSSSEADLAARLE